MVLDLVVPETEWAADGQTNISNHSFKCVELRPNPQTRHRHRVQGVLFPRLGRSPARTAALARQFVWNTATFPSDAHSSQSEDTSGYLMGTLVSTLSSATSQSIAPLADVDQSCLHVEFAMAVFHTAPIHFRRGFLSDVTCECHYG